MFQLLDFMRETLQTTKRLACLLSRLSSLNSFLQVNLCLLGCVQTLLAFAIHPCRLALFWHLSQAAVFMEAESKHSTGHAGGWSCELKGYESFEQSQKQGHGVYCWCKCKESWRTPGPSCFSGHSATPLKFPQTWFKVVLIFLLFWTSF